jgi:hypothetical protein
MNKFSVEDATWPDGEWPLYAVLFSVIIGYIIEVAVYGM